jgi:hypothetical protein
MSNLDMPDDLKITLLILIARDNILGDKFDNIVHMPQISSAQKKKYILRTEQKNPGLKLILSRQNQYQNAFILALKKKIIQTCNNSNKSYSASETPTRHYLLPLLGGHPDVVPVSQNVCLISKANSPSTPQHLALS